VVWHYSTALKKAKTKNKTKMSKQNRNNHIVLPILGWLGLFRTGSAIVGFLWRRSWMFMHQGFFIWLIIMARQKI
jgi:hypothetical protein